jgi:hypothetical protein
MKKEQLSKFIPAEPHAVLTSGEAIRLLREFKCWTHSRNMKARL